MSLVDPYSSAATVALAGALVISLDHRDLGIGKVAGRVGDAIAVEYFDSIAEPVAQRVEVPPQRLTAAPLDRQQRVYFRRRADWGVGRVIDVEFGRAQVRPPGGTGDLWLGVEELYVRWDRAMDDPTAVLQARAFETPHHYFARRGYVDTMLEHDDSTRGNRALTSSAVELYDHQVRVATRILSDPIRRFLLADEVGMGKTIEAGLIVRQHLLDHPDAVIRVVAPARICRQWERELRERFFVDDFLEATLQILPVFNARAWSLSGRNGSPDLVVVDEAHHVARWAHGAPQARERYRKAAACTRSASSLLLLSATPVAHNETTYLAMLHLLDPDNYRLSDLEAFKQRVEARHDLALALLVYRPGQSFRRLSANAEKLRALLADDGASVARLDELLDAGADAPREVLDRRIRALRVAVTDRHRVHYRMLRNRRDEASDFPVRGRRLAALLEAGAAATDDLSAWLDRWRNALVSDSTAVPDESVPVARVMLDRALALPHVFAAVVRWRLGSTAAGADALIQDEEEEELAAAPPGEEERRLLEEWLEQPTRALEDTRLQVITERVWALPRRQKVVVFATYPSSAKRIADALSEVLVEGQVALHLQVMTASACDEELRRFREDRSCNVLVCDQSAEEGLNLQFADMLIHAEIPLDPNRLEQRIGRLDRHGPDMPVENIVITDGRQGSYLDAWVTTLREGLRSFDRSISTFQFVVDRLLPELMVSIVEGGADGLAAISASIPARLEAERQKIADQDVLDAYEAVELTHPVTESLRALDECWEEHRAYHEALICEGKGHLRFARREHYERSDLYSYWERDPVRGHEPLIPRRDITQFMLGALSETERIRYGSHHRRAALARPGSRVWAGGDPFLDGLLRYVRERDDRGRAYAFCKRQPNLDEGAMVGALRFDFIVEPAAVSADDLSEDWQAALSRRARAFLPAAVETVWIGPDVTEVTDRITLLQLRAKYSQPFGDVRLRDAHWRAAEALLPRLDWEAWCTDARAMAEQVVRRRSALKERIAAACDAADRAGHARVDALRGRQRLIPDSAAGLRAEARAAVVVRAAVARPRFAVDATGFVLLMRDPSRVEHE